MAPTFASYDEHEAEPGYLSPPIHGDGSGHALPPIPASGTVTPVGRDTVVWPLSAQPVQCTSCGTRRLPRSNGQCGTCGRQTRPQPERLDRQAPTDHQPATSSANEQPYVWRDFDPHSAPPA